MNWLKFFGAQPRAVNAVTSRSSGQDTLIPGAACLEVGVHERIEAARPLGRLGGVDACDRRAQGGAQLGPQVVVDLPQVDALGLLSLHPVPPIGVSPNLLIELSGLNPPVRLVTQTRTRRGGRVACPRAASESAVS